MYINQVFLYKTKHLLMSHVAECRKNMFNSQYFSLISYILYIIVTSL